MKSGLPGSDAPRRQPLIRFTRINATSRSSVAQLPRERTRDMRSERSSRVRVSATAKSLADIFEVSGDVGTYLCDASTVWRVPVRFCPRPSRMNRVPRRAFIFPRAGAVAVFAEAVANLHFIVPNRLEPIDEQIFGGFHPRTAHYQIATVEISEFEILSV